MERHSLLRRQLKRHFGAKPIPVEWEEFLSAVDAAYREFDADRAMLERSLELSSLELLDANSDMRAIFQAIPDRFFRIDFEGKIYDYKAGAEADSHFPLKSIVGKSIDDVLSVQASARFKEAIARVRSTKSIVTIEYSLDHRGTAASYEARFLPLSTRQIIVMVRNISERKNMQAQLVFADRMASIGTISAGVAHEVNNPLTYVISNVGYALNAIEALMEGTGPFDLRSVRDSLKEALDGGERVRNIVRDLKTFSRSDDERRELVDINRVLEGAIKMVKSEISPRAQLSRHYGELPKVVANAGRLGQVFLNVLLNAAQAISEGTPLVNEISVSTRLDEQRRVVVEIRDTGCGIREEDLSRIFDPFFTTKPPGVGTGLGLAICHAITTSLGGEMRVESRPGVGTAFRIILPCVAEASPGHREGAARSRLLVVDDEAKIGVALERALEEEHEVVSETSAPAALDRLARGERFDVILCDLMMPDMSGMEFFKRLEAVRPALLKRVVFITGGAFTVSAREFLERVPNPRLTKPIDIQKLKTMLRA
jgi:signal transduction histidine kinase